MPPTMLKKNNNEPKRGKSDKILGTFRLYSTFLSVKFIYSLEMLPHNLITNVRDKRFGKW